MALVAEGTLGGGYGDEFVGWTGGLSQTTNGTTVPATPTNPNLDAGLGGFDASGDFHVVQLRSFHASLQYHFPEGWDTFLTVGYGQLSANNVATLTGATYDRAETLWANLFHDFSPQVRVGVEAGYYQTRYVSGDFAHMYRFQASGYFRL